MQKNKTYAAVIVLANLMDQQGRLNQESLARLKIGVQAYLDGEAEYLVTTGWAYRDDSQMTIADAIYNTAVKDFKIPVSAILVERNARDTVGDAFFTKRNLALPRHWKKVLVVTSEYHVARTQEIFSFIYGPQFTVEVRGAMVPETPEIQNLEQNSTLAFRKTFESVSAGDDKSIFTRLVTDHPFYNGQIHPRL